MKFKGKIIPSGNATGVEIPEDVMKSFGSEARPLISIEINGHKWRSRVAKMRGQCLIGISAANRKASGISEGETVEIDVQLDSEPRVVSEPADLSKALDDSPEARITFDNLAYGLKQKHVNSIESAKSAETRQRRITKLITTLKSNSKA